MAGRFRVSWRVVVLGLLGLVAVGVVGAVVARDAYIAGKVARAAADRAPVRRAFTDGWPEGPRPRVLLIGDSRVAHWGRHLPEGLTVRERGLPGETAVQLARRFADDALALDPDVIVVQAGINDLVTASLRPADHRRAAEAAVGAAFDRLAGAARAAGTCLVLTTIVPPAEPALVRRLVWDEAVRGMVARANAHLRGLEGVPGVSVLDAAGEIAAGGVLPAAYRRDTLHFTAAAYDRLNILLARHLSGGACPAAQAAARRDVPAGASWDSRSAR